MGSESRPRPAFPRAAPPRRWAGGARELGAVGLRKEATAAERLFKGREEDSKGYLSREDIKVALVHYLRSFLNLMSAMKTAQLYSNETSQMFTALDLKDRGFLTFKDFKRAFNSVSPKLSEKIIVEAFREVEQDSDDCISFKEFESAMKYGQDEVSPVYFA
ncbi:LOW QUALITY PROTEIN: EF-hand calcium-binding domain-containing protein 11 [Pipra filicauda]|uniref:LOW QUALITY PROTEIN: EF-hand calcium-binding domain-containing protein 11 n=1 Tax=Pipra filicauda TaxID=649802 RepID=A0A6J2I2K1_9PASS|nr:LOW QUALITY PROTEIN: EF-hand calcium-binding domain-containing protein 11 [Pipra filicauda]